MKKCYKCKELKDLSEFNKDKSRSDGLNSMCRICNRLKDKFRWDNNKEAEKARNKEYRTENKERLNKKANQNYHDNKKACHDRYDKWAKENPYKRSESNKRYVQKNIGKKYANNKKRYTNKLLRLPLWADLWKIEQFYIVAKKCSDLYGEIFHVDHIIPLQGKLVSGLHVENNLQIITQRENCQKSNSFVPVIVVEE